MRVLTVGICTPNDLSWVDLSLQPGRPRSLSDRLPPHGSWPSLGEPAQHPSWFGSAGLSRLPSWDPATRSPRPPVGQPERQDRGHRATLAWVDPHSGYLTPLGLANSKSRLTSPMSEVS